MMIDTREIGCTMNGKGVARSHRRDMRAGDRLAKAGATPRPRYRTKRSNMETDELPEDFMPYVGWTVFYLARGSADGVFDALEKRAAIVTEVIDRDTVSLAVFTPNGMFFNRNVKRGTVGGCWALFVPPEVY